MKKITLLPILFILVFSFISPSQSSGTVQNTHYNDSIVRVDELIANQTISRLIIEDSPNTIVRDNVFVLDRFDDPESSFILISNSPHSVISGNIFRGKSGPAIYLVDSDNVTIGGNQFDGTNFETKAIQIESSNDIRLTNNSISGYMIAISASKSNYTEITFNELRNNSGGVMISGSHTSLINGNQFIDIDRYGPSHIFGGISYFSSYSNLTISNNIFKNNLRFFPISIVTGLYTKNIKILNNTIVGSRFAAIQTTIAHNMEISDNTVKDTAAGIGIISATLKEDYDLVIEGNHVENVSNAISIFPNLNSLTFRGNRLSNFSTGLSLAGSGLAQVSENKFSNGDVALIVADIQSLSVTGNNFENINDMAISITNSDKTSLENNVFRTIGGSVLEVDQYSSHELTQVNNTVDGKEFVYEYSAAFLAFDLSIVPLSVFVLVYTRKQKVYPKS